MKNRKGKRRISPLGDKPRGPAARRCGGCTACCWSLRIPWLGKPERTPCEHVAPGVGCRIYATRPAECGEFRCVWLQGGLEDRDRPDRSGLLGVPSENAVQIEFHEAWPGAAETGPAKDLVARVRAAGIAVVIIAAPDAPRRMLMPITVERRPL